MKKGLNFTLMSVFLLVGFLTSLSGTLFNGILDKIAVSMDISIAQTGYLTSLYSYGAVGAPILLLLFRKVRSSLVLKSTLALYILFGFCSIIAPNFPLLLCARFILGLMGTTYGVLATTHVVALSSPEKVGRNLALLITGGAVAMMIGVPLCRVLINHYSWQMIYLVLLIFLSFGLLYYMFFLPEVQKDQEALNLKAELEMLKNNQVLLVILGSFFVMCGYGAFYTYITPYLVEMFPSLEAMMSMILVLVGASAFLGNLFGGVICDKMGYKKALWLGVVIQVVIGMVVLETKGHMMINILFAFLWMFNGWFIGLQLNTGINIATNRQSNLLVSLNGSVISFATALGASIASLVITRIGISWIMMISVVTSLCTLAEMAILNKK